MPRQHQRPIKAPFGQPLTAAEAIALKTREGQKLHKQVQEETKRVPDAKWAAMSAKLRWQSFEKRDKVREALQVYLATHTQAATQAAAGAGPAAEALADEAVQSPRTSSRKKKKKRSRTSSPPKTQADSPTSPAPQAAEEINLDEDSLEEESPGDGASAADTGR